MLDPILSLSPLDGRYRSKVENLADYFSEFGLNKYRVRVEIEWLIYMANNLKLPGVNKLSDLEVKFLKEVEGYFDVLAATRVKEIEQTTNHDVKAIEYYIKEVLENSNAKSLVEFVHLGCTSEDINNTAYALMVQEGFHTQMAPKLESLIQTLLTLAETEAATPMLSLTHGQPATPTTLGKEIINFVARLESVLKKMKEHQFTGKWNGAVGNSSALSASGLQADWIQVSKEFLTQLGLTPNLFTTQIEPHDNLAEFLNYLSQLNTILIDFSRDVWTYISRDVFKQKLKEGEIGSSTMPHKVNPIDFENAEGNLGISSAIAQHLALKLPISRMQRDLTDSTVLRNLGIVFGYHFLALNSLQNGIEKLEVNHEKLEKELDANPEVLGEAVQTAMRVAGIEKPYEKLKELTRGKKITLLDLRNFIKKLDLDNATKERLVNLTPQSYIGEAVNLVNYYLKNKK
jgi:adenylosuccinate lyase